MSKLVKVYDDVVPDYIANQIEYLTLGKENIFPWFYSTSLTFDENQKDFKFEPGIKHLIYNKEHKHYSKFIFHLSYPLYSFCLKENFLLQRVFQIRSFCHLPTPDPKPDWPPHTDQNYDHYVLLYYINDSEGDTILLEDDKKTEIIRVTPKKGRMVFFDGSIPHCNGTSTKLSRAVININMLGKFINE